MSVDAEEDALQREHLFTAGQDENWYSDCENQCQGCSTLKIDLQQDPALLPLVTYPKDYILLQPHLLTVFTVLPFIITRDEK